MYTVLDKDTIEMEIIPHIPLPKRGFPPTVPLVEIVNAILYKLKTGVQWHQLPTKVFSEEKNCTIVADNQLLTLHLETEK
jgi:transposase